MSKILPVLLGTVLIIGMSTFSVFQYNTIKKEKLNTKNLQKENSFLEESLEIETQQNILLSDDNLILRDKLKEVRDSLVLLKSELAYLKKKVKKQNKTIKQIKSQLRKVERDYVALRKHISELARKDELDEDLILRLESEKAELRKQIANLNVVRDKELVAYQATEAELLDRQVSEARFKRITDIVNNTRINFQNIYVKKKRYGRPLGKIKKENSKWRYTIIELFMIHDDLKLLLDENFIVKIVNSDTHEILSYIESNPNFPNSDIDTKGLKFKYDGNMVEIAYYNNENRTGKNYEVQIFYVTEDGEEYLLQDGTKPFIIGSKVGG
jgi:glucan-binding YG repeat protein